MIRAVVHLHSRYSYDGKLTLAELRELLIDRGIACAFMTEHTDEMNAVSAAAFIRECEDRSDERFRFVPGFEVPYRDAHILMLGSRRFVTPRADSASLRAWRDTACWCVLAHPHRNRYRLDAVEREVIDGIEVWNGQYDGKLAPRPGALKLYNTLSAAKAECARTAGLDIHRREHIGGPVMVLEATDLSENRLFAALRHGRYTIQGGDIAIPARGQWHCPPRVRCLHHASWTMIRTGKLVNAILKRLHVSLPRSLKERIRSYL